MRKTYYLDNAATAPMCSHAIGMMEHYMHEYGNPSAVHAMGRKAREAVEQARSQVAEMIGAEPDEIIFTSGATEANNTVIHHLLSRYYLITSQVEHPSVSEPIRHMTVSKPAYVSIDKEGILSFPSIMPKNDWDRPAIAGSVMLVNNETGLWHDVGAMDLYVDVLHTDITQAVPHSRVDVHDAGVQIDFASFSAHKFGGPKGVGALFVNRAFTRDIHAIDPYLFGGGQENGYRSGTENVLGIVGMGAAALVMRQYYESGSDTLHDTLELFDVLTDTLGDVAHPNFMPNVPVFSVCVPGVSNASLVMLLDAQGVYVSSGSACHGSSEEPSSVLLHMGLSREDALNTIRISPPHGMTKDDFRDALLIIRDTVLRMKTLQNCE